MIGGTDIIIPVRNADAAMVLALRATLLLWRNPVFENADTGETHADYRQLLRSGCREILAYRDTQAQAGWRELGADASLDGTMIHLIAAAGELTLAVDDVPNPVIQSFIDTVRLALRKDLHRSTAQTPRTEAA